MDQLVNLRNRVPERQRAYQNDTRALYFRAPRSRLYLGLWFSGLATGLLGITWGSVQLIKGKPKDE